MIKSIEVEIETDSGIKLKTLWCHPALRSPLAKTQKRFKKTPENPREWFDKILREYGEKGSEADEPSWGAKRGEEIMRTVLRANGC